MVLGILINGTHSMLALQWISENSHSSRREAKSYSIAAVFALPNAMWSSRKHLTPTSKRILHKPIRQCEDN